MSFNYVYHSLICYAYNIYKCIITNLMNLTSSTSNDFSYVRHHLDSPKIKEKDKYSLTSKHSVKNDLWPFSEINLSV